MKKLLMRRVERKLTGVERCLSPERRAAFVLGARLAVAALLGGFKEAELEVLVALVDAGIDAGQS